VGLKSSGGDEASGLANPQLSVRCHGFSKEAATLVLQTGEGIQVKLHIFERSYQLPVISNLEVRSRGAEFVEARFGDGTIVYRSFTF